MPQEQTSNKLQSIASRGLLLSLVVGLGSAMLYGAANADRDARYIKLRNCGAYAISKIHWDKIVKDKWYFLDGRTHEGDLQSGEAVCFDTWEINVAPFWTQKAFHQGDVARLRVVIKEGQTVTCDSTNIDEDIDGKTRIFEMGGTTMNNNGCRSIDYKSVPSFEARKECSAAGEVLKIDC